METSDKIILQLFSLLPLSPEENPLSFHIKILKADSMQLLAGGLPCSKLFGID
jgi:hypothetical protein